MLVRIEVFLQIAGDVLSINRTGPLQAEPMIYAFRMEDVQAARQHLHLVTRLILLHTDAALGILLQLLSNLVFLRPKNFLKEAERLQLGFCSVVFLGLLFLACHLLDCTFLEISLLDSKGVNLVNASLTERPHTNGLPRLLLDWHHCHA